MLGGRLRLRLVSMKTGQVKFSCAGQVKREIPHQNEHMKGAVIDFTDSPGQ
jgi:hypothetical protein